MVDTILFQTYLTALLTDRPKACSSTVQTLMDAGADFTEFYLKLFKHTLCFPWQFQSISQSIAQEHLTEVIAESIVHLVCPTLLSAKTVGGKKLLSLTPDEFHHAGGRKVTDATVQAPKFGM